MNREGRESLIFNSLKGLLGGSDGNLLSMWESWVRPLGQEDPLEKGLATHSNILTWNIPWREEPGELQSMGLQESDTT